MTASLWECIVLCSFMLTACLPLLATTFQGPLPRPVRKRRKPPQDKGLPNDNELRLLAKIFLEKSRETWPELAAAGDAATGAGRWASSYAAAELVSINSRVSSNETPPAPSWKPS